MKVSPVSGLPVSHHSSIHPLNRWFFCFINQQGRVLEAIARFSIPGVPRQAPTPNITLQVLSGFRAAPLVNRVC